MGHKKLSKVEQKKLQVKLFQAAKDGDIATIKDCLANGACINSDVSGKYNPSSETVMKVAISYNQRLVVEYLLDKCNYGIETVRFAIDGKNYHLARLLLPEVMDIASRNPALVDKQIIAVIEDIDDPDCRAMLNMILIEKQKLKEKLTSFVRGNDNILTKNEIQLITATPYLLHKPCGMMTDFDNTFLLQAILSDNDTASVQLIAMDSEKKSLDIAPHTYMANNPPLVLALKRGNSKVAEALILNSANVNLPGFRGFTPLHWACLLRLNPIIELLLEAGADASVRNAFGRQGIDYYLADISAEDISFSPTYAMIVGKSREEIDMEDIAYNASDVIFKKAEDLHKEPHKHRFATRIPDYSDLYWHIEGILHNMGFDGMIDRNAQIDERLSLYADFLVEIRNNQIINMKLVDKMKPATSVSKLSIFSGSQSVIEQIVPVETNTLQNK